MQEKVRLQQQKRKAIAEAEAALVEKKRLEAQRKDELAQRKLAE